MSWHLRDTEEHPNQCQPNLGLISEQINQVPLPTDLVVPRKMLPSLLLPLPVAPSSPDRLVEQLEADLLLQLLHLLDRHRLQVRPDALLLTKVQGKHGAYDRILKHRVSRRGATTPKAPRTDLAITQIVTLNL